MGQIEISNAWLRAQFNEPLLHPDITITNRLEIENAVALV
jgi:hypothetical protein